jgi:5'-methylthioadenosine phosphorylase
VPYRANIAALKQLGVKYIIGPSSCGSLQPNIKPGDFVICDQFIDRTWGRIDSYYHGPEVVHLIGAEPYCPTLRQIAVNACKELNIPHHQEGTVVVINGPRFSTRAESLWFTRSGFSVVNMTQYPEVVLAKEQEICYVNISLVTDYDAGVVVKGKIAPVDHKIVLATFKDNLERVRALIREIIKHLPPERPICDCREILKKSRI